MTKRRSDFQGRLSATEVVDRFLKTIKGKDDQAGGTFIDGVLHNLTGKTEATVPMRKGLGKGFEKKDIFIVSRTKDLKMRGDDDVMTRFRILRAFDILKSKWRGYEDVVQPVLGLWEGEIDVGVATTEKELAKDYMSLPDMLIPEGMGDLQDALTWITGKKFSFPTREEFE